MYATEQRLVNAEAANSAQRSPAPPAGNRALVPRTRIQPLSNTHVRSLAQVHIRPLSFTSQPQSFSQGQTIGTTDQRRNAQTRPMTTDPNAPNRGRKDPPRSKAHSTAGVPRAEVGASSGAQGLSHRAGEERVSFLSSFSIFFVSDSVISSG